MEYVAGVTLEKIIHQQTGPMQLQRITALMLPVLDAVGLAHEKGIIHRDIKPSNIMITQVGGREMPKVMDFGIAKVFADGSMQTATSSKLGTLFYMSPEQCRSSKDVDARADIYSLGITLFEMATGKVPFNLENELELMLAHRDTPPPDPQSIYPGVSDALKAVILKSLAKSPGDHFHTASAFVSALGECVEASAAVAVDPAPEISAPQTDPEPVSEPAEELLQVPIAPEPAPVADADIYLEDAVTGDFSEHPLLGDEPPESDEVPAPHLHGWPERDPPYR